LLLHLRTEHHNHLDAILLQRINNDRLWWQLAEGGSVLKHCCQLTIVGGASHGRTARIKTGGNI